MASNRTSNINMFLCFILGAIIALSVKSCVDKPTKPIETKGTFKPVTLKEIEVKDIPVILQNNPVVQKISKTDQSEIGHFKTLYNLTQKQYDSLIIVNKILDSIANASNDIRYQQLYTDCKFKEFNHIFKDCTVTATVSGITRGAPERLKFDYKLKLPKPKELIFQLRGGLELGTTKTFDKFNAKAKVGLMFKGYKELTISADIDQRFYVGYSSPIFTIER